MSPRSWSMLATGFLLSLLTSFTGACTRSLPSGISSPSGGLASPATIDAPAPLRPLAPSNAAIHEAFGRIPLHFEENRGQADPAFRFLARTAGGTLGFGPTGMFVRSKDHSVRVSFEGATPGVRLTTLDELPGRVNYLRGRDSRRWQTNIPTYARLRARQLYPGIDVVFYGTQRRLEYDFIVAPGADPGLIGLQVLGADRLEIDDGGDLVVHVGERMIVQHAPVMYQERDGARYPVDGGYVRRGRTGVAFRVGAYDRSRPLVIDPVLSYATYVGGGGADHANGIAVDASGNAYAVGGTASTDFPVAGGPQPVKSGGFDAFVVKLNATGTTLLYATYLGGSLDDEAMAVAVDSEGNAYVAGYTYSPDFPTANAVQGVLAGGAGADAFVAKLNASGSALVYSTYLGGATNDSAGAPGELARGVAVDTAGNAYVSGSTMASAFPTTPGAFQTARVDTNPNVFSAAFVAKFTTSGSLAYSSYLDGTSDDRAYGIAVDGSGAAYVVGSTTALDFPTTSGSFQPTNVTKAGQSTQTAFVTKLSPSGGSLIYSTYVGGGSADEGLAIAVWNGFAHITGHTNSADFPTVNAHQPFNADGNAGGDNPAVDAYVAKLNQSGSGLVFSTYLGGKGGDSGLGIAVDPSGGVYVSGSTGAADFPTKDAVAPFGIEGGAFLTKFDAAGTLVYSTSIGSHTSFAVPGTNILAVDAGGNAYVTGTGAPYTTSAGAFQTTPPGSADAFVVKLGPGGTGTGDATPPTVSITSPASGSWTGNSINVSATASDNAGLATIKLWGNGAVFGTISCSGTTCAGTVTWITGPLAPGAYQVQAVATDSTGNCAVSAPVTINKNGTSPAVPSGAPACGGGAGDTTPPAIAITSPASGVWTGNSINVSATARDNVGIATIKLWGNGRVFGTLTCSETACSGTVTWITGPLPSAAYQVQAVATDVAGNCAVSAPVTVYKNGTSPTVASGAPPCSGGGGGGDTTPPTASIASPPSGVWTGNSINVSASATDTVGLATIKLWGNGGVFGTLTCGGTTCSGTVTWITGALPPGAYQVQAVATDGAGNTANSTAITIYKDGTAPVVPSGAP